MEKFLVSYISLFIFIFIFIFIFLCFNSPGHAFHGNHGSSHLGTHVKGRLLGVVNKNFITRETDEMIKPSDFGTNSIFNVKDYGAKGDGKTDDSGAFLAAFGKACKVPYGVMLVPTRSKFLLQTITFQGDNCQRNITVQVEGEIVAPSQISDWKVVDFQWVHFVNFRNGITISGNGVVDGSGQDWWIARENGTLKYDSTSCEPKTVGGHGGKPPNAIKIENSNDVMVTRITIRNSPLFHIFIDDCQHVSISNLNISSPEDSPNTDGIHLTESQHVHIHDCTIAAGDDCISIQKEVFDVEIHDVHCGPSHGYSIGGLGKCKENVHVSGIIVHDSTIANSDAGVRIKTWQGGSGTASNVTFRNIQMEGVKTAMVIDQNYCGGGDHKCNWSGTNSKNAVAISDVTYKGIIGTYTHQSVSLDCSKFQPCKNIIIDTINLNPKGSRQKLGPFCSDAFGKVLTNTTPSLRDCLRT